MENIIKYVLVLRLVLGTGSERLQLSNAARASKVGSPTVVLQSRFSQPERPIADKLRGWSVFHVAGPDRTTWFVSISPSEHSSNRSATRSPLSFITMSRPILVTGATGNQGGALVDALLSRQAADFTILAVTRDPNSASAKRLLAKSPTIKLVEGNLDDVPALFATAQQIASAASSSIWGVYSVQSSMGKGATSDGEVLQGTSLIDESIKAGVKHFVYSSVKRGGEARSWDNPTRIPHFMTKHCIEHHLRDSTTSGDGAEMGWTILRPSTFMDNLQPGLFSKVFMTALRDTMGDKSMQWVATKDIGVFAAMAFEQPDRWSGRAVSLSGDQLTFQQLDEVFQKVTGSPVPTTFWVLGSAFKYGLTEVRTMVDWFKEEGCKADIKELRQVHSELMDVEAWLKTQSLYTR